MDGRTVPKIRTGTEFGTWYGFLVRDLMVWHVVRIFGTDFFQYGTWYGFWSGLEPGTVRGTDFGTKKSVPVRIFFRYGTWYGPKFRKIEKIKGPFQISIKMKNIRTDRTDEASARTNIL